MDLKRIKLDDIIVINHQEYLVAGFIKYQNNYSNGHTCFWYDYKLKLVEDAFKEAWMSITKGEENEFCLSYMTNDNVPPFDSKLIEEGEQVVLECSGDVDVEVGDRAYFKEYEDEEGDNSFSIESWNDEVEYSVGVYYDADEATPQNSNSYASFQSNPKEQPKKSSKKGCLIAAIIGIVALFFGWCGSENKTPLHDYIKASPVFSHVAQIGKEDKKADVYKSDYTIDQTAKFLIAAIDGNSIDVTQNTDSLDNSIGFITDNEYCLIYNPEEDSTKVLVQISDREFACSSEEEPYHASHHTRHFYHCHYYSFGFFTDRSRYSTHSSHYSNYNGPVMSKTANSYNNYSSQYRATSSARNGSTRSSSSRSHSSGGSHGGK